MQGAATSTVLRHGGLVERLPASQLDLVVTRYELTLVRGMYQMRYTAASFIHRLRQLFMASVDDWASAQRHLLRVFLRDPLFNSDRQPCNNGG